MKNSHCPICHKPAVIDPRYPRAVCAACVERTVDAYGRPVQFFNTGLSGGLTGCYADDGTLYTSMECFIDGHICQANERHLGGVVIELVVQEIPGTSSLDEHGEALPGQVY